MSRLVLPAVVVRTVDYGEADRVVTMITREHGKLSAIARAARKSTRRFGAGLSLFGIGEATLVEKAGAELMTLETFHSSRGFPGLQLEVAKVAHGGYACELVRELLPPRQPEPVAFDLLCGFLALLEARDPRAETLRVFELRLLDAAGLRPELETCRACGTAELDGEGQVFDVRRGGVVCGACHGHGVPLFGEARRAMCRAQSMGLLQSAELELSTAVNAACRDAISALITDHLGRTLRSVEFIAKLNHAST